MELSLGRPLPAGVGRVSQWFGSFPDWYKQFGLAGHNGIDYACPARAHVLSMIDGQVVKVADQGADGYGRYVTIRNEVCETTYAHLSEQRVTVGKFVEIGDVIGLSGNTGNSTGPHLHVTLKIRWMRSQAYLGAVDPAPFRDI